MSPYAIQLALRAVLPPAVQIGITVAIGALLVAVEIVRAIRPNSRLVGALEIATIPGLTLFCVVLIVRSVGLFLG